MQDYLVSYIRAQNTIMNEQCSIVQKLRTKYKIVRTRTIQLILQLILLQ